MKRILLSLVVLAGCDLRQLALTGDGGGTTRDAAGGAGGVGGAGGSGGIDAPRPDASIIDAGPDACVPMPEICNGIDDDCDGVIDNGFDLNTDPNNCGMCGHQCLFPNATALCVGGQCALGNCAFGYGDADHNPANGCECVKTNGGVEICDGIDNDCNGVIDDNFNLQTDPMNCGTCGHRCTFANAIGACTAGQCVLDRCLPGFYDIDGNPDNGCEYGCLVSNGGTEICDGLDNDCNGMIDDNPIDAGQACFPFGNGCTPNGSGGFNCAGVCRAGTTTCANGFLQCLGFTGPSIEICDNLDNDCNGIVDDPFNKQTDPLHCGSCSPCAIPHAIPDCVNGVCGILACAPDYYNIDGNLANGCEYNCHATGPEVCDGLDNNCNGQIDEGFDKLNDPNNCGASCTRCSFPHASALCNNGTCALGTCDPGYVNLDGNAANGCEYQCTFTSATEICNGVDDNCNGQVDEGFNLQTDVNNCGSCGHICQFNHAAAACVNGGCMMGACNAGFVNLNGQTSDGCEYQCTITNGGVEICDGLDNNCNGVVDENNPGGGQPCNPALPNDPSRWSVGVCRAGTTQCTNGNLVCNGYAGPAPQQCGIDWNCDGQFHEGFDLLNDANNCGSCGHVCRNDFTTGTPHAVPGCSGGTCTIVACDAGFYNNDGQFANGCEYACPGTPGTPEVCDGVDNDCDGLTDGADTHLGCTSNAQCPQAALGETCVTNRCSATITTSCTNNTQCPAGETCIAAGRCTGDIRQVANFCNQVGACAGAVPQCTSGAWVCNYGPNVQTTGPNQIIGNETLCDGIDNDCDGCIDESFPQVAHPAGTTCAAQSASGCSDTGIGACQRTGTFQCDLNSSSPTYRTAICVLTSPVVTPTNEVCDGLDNDCDGLVDESWDDPSGTTRCSGSRCTGVRPSTALIGSVNVGKFESSRADSTRTNCPTVACPLGSQCNTNTHECELPCTTSNASTLCASGICVVANGSTSGFCQPSQGGIGPTPCTSNAGCASGACVRLADGPTAAGEPASGCTSLSGQPLCFCLPATGAQAPLACSVQNAEPWSSVTIQQAEFACELAGMRLCTAADWTSACGGSAFPYGTTYAANNCNGHDFDGDSLVGGDQDMPAPTGNLPLCTTGTSIFDLSGNLAEWTNDFTGVRLTVSGTANVAVYRLRGGSFSTPSDSNLMTATGLQCNFTGDVVPENFVFPDTGFRCCSACAAGQADCGAAGCKTLSNDAANCGYCGHACGGGQLCCNGVCRTTASCPALP